ncbi:MAG: N-6 DNA methylase [Anaerolineales bacterium]|nr:N-6 DNA methylase [Anaerolineales bacterium]
MAPLPGELRGSIEKTIIKARDAAEGAAVSALAVLQVQSERLPAGFPEAQRTLRNALRARARQLGQGQFKDGWKPLVEEVAYEQWHRMLFARFLAENNLLMHPEGAPVTLDECAELAEAEREPDAWALAARYASQMLPGIFRLDDPSAQVRLTPEGRRALEDYLLRLPSILFTADDGLGWVYQFWQAIKKEQVNAAAQRIGGADLFPVTQLFTEDYMVRFLLENSLGAWWAARKPSSPLVKEFTYLRFHDSGIPIAGTFSGWPAHAAELTILDPCCGSGHFLVSAFDMLFRMRQEEEGLDNAEAATAVLRDNLYGLELDLRCTQIAAFALALAAWKKGGPRELPIPNVACSGMPVQGQLADWTKLAGGDVNLRTTLERLYYLFQNAQDLGSLINLANVPLRDRMLTPDYSVVSTTLSAAVARSATADDPVSRVFGATADAALRALRILTGHYSLVATNVPYLTRGKQNDTLQTYCEDYHNHAKADLATVFVERSLSFLHGGGSLAVVTPHSWLFQGAYRQFRQDMLTATAWSVVARIGAGGFASIGGEVVNVVLFICSATQPDPDHVFVSLDASAADSPSAKAEALRSTVVHALSQTGQKSNPDARVTLEERSAAPLLSRYARTYQGIKTGDDPRYRRHFWEVGELGGRWRFYQGSVSQSVAYGGLDGVIDWQQSGRNMARLQGKGAWNKAGVAISQMTGLGWSMYCGDIFDSNISPIIPNDPRDLKAIWAFCSSKEYRDAVQQIDKALKVTNSSLIKVPFDIGHWRKVAEDIDSLPEAESFDPSQWIFKGMIDRASYPLQVAVSRLLGFQWPNQKVDNLADYIDEDGLVCLPSVAGELPASERLRALLAAALGADWLNAKQDELLSSNGARAVSIADWLRDEFFRQHCALFHNRPFVWHIWDGHREGFSALVNYHRFGAALLDKLIYTYLGTWITDRRADLAAGAAGAEGRLVAALNLKEKLEAIRDGEPPYDIYVRWKPLQEQTIGWNPDLNDGVRLNVRPFVLADILRTKFRIHWNKSPGKNPDGSERHNDLHYSVDQKLVARKKAGVKAR